MTNPMAVAKEWLSADLAGHWQRVHAALLAELLAEWLQWRNSRIAQGDAALADQEQIGPSLLVWLLGYVGTRCQELDRLLALQGRFLADYERGRDQTERQRIILDYAQELGSRRRQLSGDRQAFKRWFDRDALVDRCLYQRARQEQRLAFALERIGVVAARVGRAALAAGQAATLVWSKLALETPIRDMLAHEGDQRVALAAFRALASALYPFPATDSHQLVAEATLRYIYRSALESRQDVWIQVVALELLASLSPASLEVALKQRLGRPEDGDDLFVRRRAVALLVVNLVACPGLVALLDKVMVDPSPFVRQGLAQALAESSWGQSVTILTKLASQDREPSVRAAAILALVKHAECTPEIHNTPLLALFCERMLAEQEPFVLRTLLLAMVMFCRILASQEQTESAPAIMASLFAAVSHCSATAEQIICRRWAAQAGERMWLAMNPDAERVAGLLLPVLAKIPPGSSRPLAGKIVGLVPAQTLGRILAVLAQDDFPLELEKRLFGYRLHRGHRFCFRWWRLIHEMRHPSPDKRQGFSHLLGRQLRGHYRAVSAILNEMSPTKVPGEPLYIEFEGGWRPYLPLLDDMISVLEQGKKISLYSSQGILEIRPPRWLWQRIAAMIVLNVHFAHYAAMRNYRLDQGNDPREYTKSLTKLGFGFSFSPHYVDPTVQRFFSLTASLAFLDSDLLRRFEDYFFSVYENTINELTIFSTLALVVFLGQHFWRGRQTRRIRNLLPLVIGGWGTRGKSGTERLKAAVFHSYGLAVISKTTGCEAMFIHAPAFMSAREMFLFRPYDKASIWEQSNLLSISQQLDCQVFLWECMALTPSYVRLLQRDWMRDDFSTITNAYPDHEDLQGPAGINIPEVIAQFIPERSHVVSSEEQMAPILRFEAQRLGTSLAEVGWLEAGLLTPDILRRFPYAEHPNNIALVSRLCTQLGFKVDETLKSMADAVIPDIGVLKIYPKSFGNGRWLSFVNGMSANERLGCLGNWQRIGFADNNPEKEPEVWISTVINNRADRVSRSKVFARLLVQDVRADLTVLIGDNLAGLHGYIEEELTSWLSTLSLWPDAESKTPVQVWEKQAKSLRIPTTVAAVTGRIAAMLRGVGLAAAQAMELAGQWQQAEGLAGLDDHVNGSLATEIRLWSSRLGANWQEFEAVRSKLSVVQPQQQNELDALVRQQFRRWFLAKLVVVWNYHATGNDIVRILLEQTPPGLHNRSMGMQNIKGTGLDFVYRWQAWEQCHSACIDMLSDDSARFAHGLRNLTDFQEYGPLCASLVQETLAKAKTVPEAQTERVQAALALILSNLESALARDLATASAHGQNGGWFDWLITAVEAFLDAGDAIDRRKMANRIYQDLIAVRISRQRASELLGELIKRQKGGWLKKKIFGFSKRFSQ